MKRAHVLGKASPKYIRWYFYTIWH